MHHISIDLLALPQAKREEIWIFSISQSNHSLVLTLDLLNHFMHGFSLVLYQRVKTTSSSEVISRAADFPKMFNSWQGWGENYCRCSNIHTVVLSVRMYVCECIYRYSIGQYHSLILFKVSFPDSWSIIAAMAKTKNMQDARTRRLAGCATASCDTSLLTRPRPPAGRHWPHRNVFGQPSGAA